ncbi:MAG: hypothetical protein C5S48_08430 [Candidatus Methanogaster sp.]|nr:MAG: hypothetical protein C5S48_08430 [ANME-2 cluster archaeon]
MLLKTELCSKKDVTDIIKKIEKTDRRMIELKLVLMQVWNPTGSHYCTPLL